MGGYRIVEVLLYRGEYRGRGRGGCPSVGYWE